MVQKADWILRLAFRTENERAIAAETLATVFEELGALGCEEPQASPSKAVSFDVFFPATADRRQSRQSVEHATRRLRRAGVLRHVPAISSHTLVPHDWVAECRRGFRGVRVGPRIRVVPPWKRRRIPRPARTGEIEIIIQPGAAFGTGLHETTRLCLRLLQREIQGGERVVDVGAGSAILSIAAVRLGARSAHAIEIDPEACENLANNVRLNGLGRQVRTFAGNLADYAAERRKAARRPRGFDLLVCNMLPEKMQMLLPLFRDLMNPATSTTAIIAGHLWSERKDIARRLENIGIAIAKHHKFGDWGAIVGDLIPSNTAKQHGRSGRL